MAVDEDVELLAQVPLFEGIDDAHLRVIAYAAEQQTVPAGDWLVRQGQELPAGFLVRGGTAEAYMEEDPATRLNISRGAFIGDGAMIAGLPHRMNVRALEELHLLRIPRELFLHVCHEFPEMGKLVMANYARRMATVMSALQTLLP